MKTDKASTLRFGGLIKNRNRASEMYRPNELNVSAEAWICLNCPLPECNKINCKRYKDMKRELKSRRKNK